MRTFLQAPTTDPSCNCGECDGSCACPCVCHGQARCPGSGQTALLEPASGFYGCGVCKVPQGVILRAGNYLTPLHNFGEMYRAPGDTTFVQRGPEHGMPILQLAAQQGLPKDMVIDLLVQAVMRAQSMLVRKAESTATQSAIVLTGFDKPS